MKGSQMRPDLRDFEDYFGKLTDNFNQKNQKQTTGCTLLTTFSNSSIGSNIMTSDRVAYSQQTAPLPQTCFVSKQLNTTVINTQNYLFDSPQNEYPSSSAVNLLYFLTIFAKVRVLLVIKQSDVEDQNSTSVIQILTSLGEIIINKSNASKDFSKCIGIAVEDARDFNVQSYVMRLKTVLQKPAFKKLKSQAANLFQDILQNKKIVLYSPKKLLKNSLLQLKPIPQFSAKPKSLTLLFQEIVVPRQLIMLQKQYKDIYCKNSKEIFDALKQSFECKNIFSEDEVQRENQLQQLLARIPILLGQKQSSVKDNSTKKIDQFAVQSAYFILVQLQGFEEQFQQINKKLSYSKYNQKNQAKQLNNEDNLMNVSVVAKVLEIVFSDLNIYSDQRMRRVAHYMQTLFKFFDNLPDLGIRAFELNHFKDIFELMKHLVQYFFQCIVIVGQNVLQSKFKSLSPVKLLNLTYDIKCLINFENKLKQNKNSRKQYAQIVELIQQHFILLIPAFLFCSWRCYEIYMKYWSPEQKNCFMLEIYQICINQQYKEFLGGHKMKKSTRIYKKINEYFGDHYRKQNKYFIATKFYSAARMNWKQMELINLWLQKMLQQNTFIIADIEANITKLSRLGLSEEARKWCYKFMDKLDQNSQFIIILQDITNLQINQQRMVMQQIAKLKFDQLLTVQKQLFDVVRRELSLEQWLIQKI